MSDFEQPFWSSWFSSWKSIRALDRSTSELEPTSPVGFRRSLLSLYLIAILFATPWNNGCRDWIFQSYLLLAVLPLAILAPLFVLSRRRRHRIPGVTILLSAIACFGAIQTIPFASITGDGWAPGSVRIQRWALGESNQVGPGFFAANMQHAIDHGNQPGMDATSTLTVLPPSELNRKLSISMDPWRTRTALGTLCVAAVLIWLSSIAFDHRRTQLGLIAAIIICGLLVTGMSFIQHVSWRIPDWAFVRDATSVGPFANKNNGGAYLNLALAAIFGVTYAAIEAGLNATKQYDTRYKLTTQNKLVNIFLKFSAGLRELTTGQVAGIVLTIIFASAVVGSFSRGAAISALLAGIITIALSGSKSRSSYWVLIAIIAAGAMGVLMLFDQDRVAADRFGNLMEGESVEEGGRLFVWWGSLRGFLYYCLTGSGFSCFRWGMFPFLENLGPVWYCYAESIWGHVLVELGIFGLLALAMLLREFRWLLGSVSVTGDVMKRNPALLAGFFAIACFVIHGLVDFGIILPGVFVPLCMLIGAAYGSWNSEHRLSHQSAHSARPLSTKSHRESLKSEALEPDSREEVSQEPSEREEGGESIQPKEPAAKRKLNKLSHRKSHSRKSRRATMSRGMHSWLTRFQSAGPLGFLLAISLSGLMTWSWLAVEPQIRAEFAAQWLEEFSNTQEFVEYEEILPEFKAIWENESPVTQPEGVRTLDTVELGKWRQDYLAFLRKTEPRAAWYLSDPILIRVAAARLEKAQKPIANLMGGEEMVARLTEIQARARVARLQCPMDWRLLADQMVLDWRSSPKVDRTLACRMSVLGVPQPQRLIEAGWISLEAGDRELANHCFRRAIQMQRGLAVSIGAILASSSKDEEIDVTIFPRSISELQSIATQSLVEEPFPKSNKALWEAIREIATATSRLEPDRWKWLAQAEFHLGNPDAGIKMLEELVHSDEERIEHWLLLHSELVRIGETQKAENVAVEMRDRFAGDPRVPAIRSR